jgi:hypothetical protein
MNFIGADMHSLNFTVAYLNTRGKLARVWQRPTSARHLIEALSEIPGPKTLVVEESHLAQWVKHSVEAYVDKLIICDPRRNRWIAGDDFADDKSSAIKLATLACGGYIKEIRHADDDGAALRSTFLHYYDLNKQGVRFKNKLKGKFRQVALRVEGDGIYDPDDHEDWLERLRAFPHLRHQAADLFALIDQLENFKDDTYKQMTRLASKQTAYKLLQTIPGVGPVLATGYIALLDTPHRFSRRNKLWRYACLGNCYHRSDDMVYKNRRSKSGNRALKWIVRTHYQSALERCGQLNRFKRKRRECLERGLNEKATRRLVCRSLLSTVRAVWMKEEAYRDRVS